MALTYTPQAELGAPCPTFELPTVDGQRFRSMDLKNHSALVVMFICNHCPYVQAIEDRLIKLAGDLQKAGAVVVGICSNDSADYPEDSAPELLKRWREKNYSFPYLIDESQDVAKAFGAVCTPDFFVFDKNGSLRYRGRLDDSWRDPQGVRRQELKDATLAIIAGKPVNPEQNSSMGCSIKWKSND